MEVPVLRRSACIRCGDFLDFPTEPVSGPAFCRACRLAPPDFERAVSYGPYEDRMRGVIHALKYDQMHPAARRMGAMLAQAIAKLAAEAPKEMLVVPVPLHRSKQSERGFNQARLLASHALAALRISHPAWQLKLAPATLMRLRSTETQAGLTPRQRRLNVRGAFQVASPDSIRGQAVLLIDDIITTGATARSASRALKRAGADTVWVATLARAGRIHGRKREIAERLTLNQDSMQGADVSVGSHAESEETAG
jgi:ComF family protein